VRYQVLDPSFNKGNLGGNLITVIDGIATVSMTPQQASYWLTQGAVLPLGAAGQINYQLASPGLVVSSPIIDVPTETVSVFATNLYCGSPEIDMPVAVEIDTLVSASLTVKSPGIDVPTFMQTYPWLPYINGVAPSMFADFRASKFFAGVPQADLPTWLTAIGATFSRSGPATYMDRGVVKTAPANVIRLPTDLDGNPLGMRFTSTVTNIWLQSSNMLASPWAGTLTNGGSIIGSVGPSPDGTNNAFLITSNTSGATSYGYIATGGVVLTPQTSTIFAKPDTSPTFNYAIYNQTRSNAFVNVAINWNTPGPPTVAFNPGSIASNVSGVITRLADGWYRFDCTYTAIAPAVAGDQLRLIIYPENTGGANTGVGTYFWGPQFTNTAGGVDYVPTTTTAVSQAVDLITAPYTQATMSALASFSDVPGIIGSVGGIVGFTQNAALLFLANSTSPFRSFNGAVTLSGPPGTIGGLHRMMVAGGPAGRSIVIDGGAPVSDASALVTTTPTALQIGGYNSANQLNGNLGSFSLWSNLIASAADLTRLTTITGPSWLPTANGYAPALYADFINNNYWWLGSVTSDVYTWLTGIGGTHTRPSPASYIENGVVKFVSANALRFPLGGGIRLTGAITNLMPHSQYDNISFFSTGAATLTPNVAVAPDGSMTAASFVPTAGTGIHTTAYAAGIGSQASGNVYTYAVMVAPFGPNAQNYLLMLDPRNAGVETPVFSFAGSGSVVNNIGGASPFIIKLANGWFIIGVTYTNPITGNRTGAVSMCDAAGNRSVAADGVSGWYVWGQNYTQTAFLADYVPTVAAAATQSADILNIPQAFSAAGTVLVNTNNQLSFGTAIFVGQGDTLASWIGAFSVSTTGQQSGTFNGSRTLSMNFAPATFAGACKTASAGDTGGSAVVTNGGAVSSDAGIYFGSPSPTKIQIGARNNASYSYGNISAFGAWTIKASNTELQRLTT
jgi:hypothetical protein